MWTEELLSLTRTWGVVVGLGFDIMGAILVYNGVRVSLVKADALEQIELPRLFDDVGSSENLERNRQLSLRRAAERFRASRWAAFGLGCFILGFLLQIIGGWPRRQ